jgi:hypothetical protein
MPTHRLAGVATFVVCGIWTALLVVPSGQTKSSSAERITVTDPRPLAAAVLEVEARFGKVVTYEDSGYEHPSQIEDVTSSVSRSGDLSKRVLVPKASTIDVRYEILPGTLSTFEQVRTLLLDLIGQSNQSGRLGQFQLDVVPGAYHVVPTAMKGSDGLMKPYTPLLDTRITIPFQVVDGLDMLSRLAEAVTRKGGRRLLIGTVPIGTLGRASIRLDAASESARSVLWSALQAVDPSLSWQLLCEPGEGADCYLNVHPLPRR